MALQLDEDQASGTVRTLSHFFQLPNLCCQAAGGDPRWADELSAAWVLFYAAADIMDSVQDEDAPEEWWVNAGPGAALSAASGLYFSASRILNNLYNNSHDVGTISNVIEHFYDLFLLMCSGQYRDIVAGQPTLEDYWKIVEAKSGAFFALACRCGARLATDNAALLEGFSEYGYRLGVLIQIKDELEDVLSPSEIGGIGQRPEFARSLPVLYALEVLPEVDKMKLMENLAAARTSSEAAEAAVEIIDESGAAIYLLAKMERHRIKGENALRLVAEESPVLNILLDTIKTI